MRGIERKVPLLEEYRQHGYSKSEFREANEQHLKHVIEESPQVDASACDSHVSSRCGRRHCNECQQYNLFEEYSLSFHLQAKKYLYFVCTLAVCKHDSLPD
jgi:hypothetical protein